MSDDFVYDVIIVGGGLSGLTIARDLCLNHSEKSFVLLDARDKFGGRISNDSKGYGIDMGGAWIWPHAQRLMHEFVTKDLSGIQLFPQPGVNEDGAYRISGGSYVIIRRILEDISKKMNLKKEEQILRLNCAVTSIDDESVNDDHKIQVAFINESNHNDTIYSKKVVIAVPPRIAVEKIQFHPKLCPQKERTMRASNTWMAGITKVTLIYQSRFWPTDKGHLCNMGLWNRRIHGEVCSAFQVYDASDESNEIVALTFFAIVTKHSNEKVHEHDLAEHCANQLADVWQEYTEGWSSIPQGKELRHSVRNFVGFDVKRWSFEEYISEKKFPTKVMPHPSPEYNLAKSDWSGKLMFAGTESDMRSPGVMEGAVSAAKRTIRDLETS